MNDFVGAEVGYGARKMEIDVEASPQPDQGAREPLTIRAPGKVLQQARAAAEAETLALEIEGAKGEVTLNGMIVHALEAFFAGYEKIHGALPPPTPPEEAKPKKKGEKPRHSPEIRKYAESKAAKKRGD